MKSLCLLPFLALAATALPCAAESPVNGIAAAPATIPPPSEVAVPDFPTVTFSNAVPTEFSADAHSRLSISGTVFRDKAPASLRWDWDAPGASITFRHPEAFKHLTGEKPDPIVYDWITMTNLSAFSLWVFCDTPIPEPLRFEIGDGKTVDSRFWMNLNFRGWRELKFLYGRDLAGFPNPKTADTLRILAPGGIAGGTGPNATTGTLYFSEFCPRKESDVRFVRPTMEAPWVGNSPVRKLTKLGPFDAMPMENVAAPLRLSDEQIAILREITARKWQAPAPKPSEKEVETLIASLQNGAAELPPMNLQKLFSLREPLMKAGAWDLVMARTRKNPADAFDPGVDGLYTAPVCESPLSVFYSSGDLLKRILLQDDNRNKWCDLAALQRCANWAAEHGNFQSDGIVNFHIMINEGYGLPAVRDLASILPTLHGTPFEAKTAEAVCKRALKAEYFFSFPSQGPHCFSGRHRVGWGYGWDFAKNQILPIALCGTPETGGVDRELAAIYLLYVQYFKKTDAEAPEAARFRAMGIQPASPEGHQTFNYAVAGVHRRGNWMAVVNGQKQGMKANEMYGFQACNTMGRFIHYGQIAVHSKGDPITPAASGEFFWRPVANPQDSQPIVHGWNWALWTGATTRLLPHEALRSRFEVEEMITNEPFAGDTSLDGNGVFGLKLDETLPGALDSTRIGPVKYWLGQKRYDQIVREARYDTGFHARKSYFMFDDRIVCLGSGIDSTDDTYPAVTTLFQHPLTAEQLRVEPATGAHWRMDSFGNGYYLPEGNNALRIERKLQKLPFHPYWRPSEPAKHALVDANEGETELAYFDHGVKAAGAGYEYAMRIDTTAEKMADFAKAPPYRVLRRDQAAHILRDLPNRTTGFVVFEPGAVGQGLAQASAPCLVLIKDLSDHQRKVSFCNPDLGRQYANTGPLHEIEQTASITVEGRWRLSEESAQVQCTVQSDSTVLTFKTRGAKPALVTLDSER